MQPFVSRRCSQSAVRPLSAELCWRSIVSDCCLAAGRSETGFDSRRLIRWCLLLFACTPNQTNKHTNSWLGYSRASRRNWSSEIDSQASRRPVSMAIAVIITRRQQCAVQMLIKNTRSKRRRSSFLRPSDKSSASICGQSLRKLQPNHIDDRLQNPARSCSGATQRVARTSACGLDGLLSLLSQVKGRSAQGFRAGLMSSGESEHKIST